MSNAMNLNNDMNITLTGAVGRGGYNITTYDDMFGDLWAIGNEYGVVMITRAQSPEDAWDIFLDESMPISESEIEDVLEMTKEQGLEESGFLLEGYEYQPNSTGTGIVDVGYYTTISPVTQEFLCARDITLQVTQECAA